MRKKRKFRFLATALAAALVFFIAGFFWWKWATLPVSPKMAKSQIFVVKKGENLTSVANRLDQEGLIKSSLAFKVLVLTQGLSGKIQAGDFRLQPSLSTPEIAYVLTHGTLDIWLTFPEGWRKEEFGRRLVANLEDFSYPQFSDLTRDLEGYLFPDTYLIPKEASPSAVIKIFTNNFERNFSLDLELATKEKGLSKEQVVILASIVERESRAEKDRPIIAGILLKRWRKNWPLQADATIQYSIGSERCNKTFIPEEKCNYWEPVGKADLKINTLYNTYKYKGLPLTPICNPGLSSIKAVIYPQESELWFYLSDKEGKIHYAKTAEEHEENIEKYLK